MKIDFKDKVIVVSGSSKGIGLKIAQSFLESEGKVVILGRTKSVLDKINQNFSESFSLDSFLILQCDVTDPNQVKSALTKVQEEWNAIDIVIANVGDGRSVSDPLPSQSDFSKSWNTNFTSAETLARESIQGLIKSNGSLVFISSIAGLESIGAPTDYSIAKSAIIALSKNLARKLAPNVRVNCIAPGNVFFPGGSWDERIKKDPDRIQNLIETAVPMKRFGTPEEIANAVLFLASEKASFVTGACLVVDGGQTVGFH